VVRARSVADLRPLRMTDGVGRVGALVQCNARFVEPAFLVEGFGTHLLAQNMERMGHPHFSWGCGVMEVGASDRALRIRAGGTIAVRTAFVFSG